ncbi:hypothetical protein KIN20_031170 [Parelaphostrongylus tenuis]|uniref:Uncharacterized protein n=1 Tax=Parelaphostrongylus tenuis TaxID=148309 RepID=A0AAD5R6F3_PARTN|nr:hypothetical protein KIN20_031170 [Parelaphostrongylus tenuis]
MARLPKDAFVILLFAVFTTVLGCGVMPAGRASTRTFNVTGLTTMPVAMVYSAVPNIQAQVPDIAPNEGGARAFVQRLVMQTTSKIIMANWLRMMWQSVVDRALRMLGSGLFGSYFFSAKAIVG